MLSAIIVLALISFNCGKCEDSSPGSGPLEYDSSPEYGPPEYESSPGSGPEDYDYEFTPSEWRIYDDETTTGMPVLSFSKD